MPKRNKKLHNWKKKSESIWNRSHNSKRNQEKMKSQEESFIMLFKSWREIFEFIAELDQVCTLFMTMMMMMKIVMITNNPIATDSTNVYTFPSQSSLELNAPPEKNVLGQKEAKGKKWVLISLCLSLSFSLSIHDNY